MTQPYIQFRRVIKRNLFGPFSFLVYFFCMTISLHFGDCLEVMKDIPDQSVDMILCDLPYGTTACKWDTVIPFEPLWAQYWRVIKQNGAIVLFGSEPFSSHLRMSQIKYFKYDWIWTKNLPTGFAYAKHRPMLSHEVVSVFCMGKHFYSAQKVDSKISDRKLGVVNNKKRHQSKNEVCNGLGNDSEIFLHEKVSPRSVLTFSCVPRATGTLHPTQKPVALLEYLIKTYTHEGETVLDNCMGSGSTGVAALNTNRNFIGIEKDEKYFKIAKERIESTPLKLF